MCCKSGKQTVYSGDIPIIRNNYNSSPHTDTPSEELNALADVDRVFFLWPIDHTVFLSA